MVANQLRRRKVDSSTEKNILTAMIVSTQFLQEVVHLINFDYFQNLYIRKVVRWCTEHYDRYEVAPFDDITTIFRNKKIELQEDDADLVEKLLMNISTKYSFNTGINVPYQVDQTLLFFKKRELEITNSNIGILLDKNDIEGAEDQINNFAKISKITSGWIDPFQDQFVDAIFKTQNTMFKFPGELGDFLGGFNPGWLVAIAAGYKRGKTWSLQEIAIHGVQQRLRVAMFSLEMGQSESNDRWYKRILGAGSPEGGLAVYPCFDCESNQDGSCTKPERTNKLPLMKGGSKPQFHPDMKYRVCTSCRYTNKKDYRVAWWMELLDRPAYNSTNIKRRLEALRKAWPNFYRFKQYPKFSATLSDIERDLDILERVDGFVPNIILIDQANGVKPETGISLDGIAPHAAVWRGMASLAGKRHALVVSPTQITRAALDHKSVKQSDVAQWVGLLGDVDAAYALGQTPEEKKEGVMRYTKLIHRHIDFSDEDACIVLQKIKFGQVYLDAHILSSGVESHNPFAI